MENKTQKLRKKVMAAVAKEQSNELLEAAYQILTEQSIWASPEIEQAWMKEIDRRKKNVAEGKSKLIPGDEVFAKAQKIIDGK